MTPLAPRVTGAAGAAPVIRPASRSDRLTTAEHDEDYVGALDSFFENSTQSTDQADVDRAFEDVIKRAR